MLLTFRYKMEVLAMMLKVCFVLHHFPLLLTVPLVLLLFQIFPGNILVSWNEDPD